MSEIPQSLAPLPSKGIIYSHESLKNKDSLAIRPMKVKELNMFNSQAYLRQGIVIDKVVESCLIDKSVPVKELITADKEMLMITIRILTYGKDFTQEDITCPECQNKESKYKFDLQGVKYESLSLVPLETNTNIFSYKLPVSQKEIKFKFLTSDDEREIEAIQEMKVKKNLEENEITERLSRHLAYVEGITDKAKIVKYVEEEMDAVDIKELLTYIDENKPRIHSSLTFTCPKCKVPTDMFVPIARSFFLHK